MAGLLLEPGLDTENSTSTVLLLAQLSREVAELRAEVARRRRENLELRQQAGYWQSQHADAVRRIAALEQENEHLRGEHRKLQAQAFGRKSEKQSPSDRSNQLDDPDEPTTRRSRGQQRGRPGPQRRDYRHLPVREELLELPEAKRVCPHCGLALVACGTEDAEQIEIETVLYRHVTHRRRYQRTCQCPGQRTWTAPPTPQLIPKGRLGVSVWVEIFLDKNLVPTFHVGTCQPAADATVAPALAVPGPGSSARHGGRWFTAFGTPVSTGPGGLVRTQPAVRPDAG